MTVAPAAGVVLPKAVMLDTGPLSLAASPARSPDALGCQHWIASLRLAGIPIYLPEIADYEVRRELLRARKTASVARLNRLRLSTYYVPTTTPGMQRAAVLWATARQHGQPTAPDYSLDADVILAAQAQELAVPDLVIATSNPRHLSRFVPAFLWRQITA